MLGWLEMKEEDQPPEAIWLDPEAIQGHFEKVKEKYEAQSAGNEVVSESGDYAENEAVKGLRR